MKALVIVIISLFAVIVGISVYLTPNDFRGCDRSSRPAAGMSCHGADAIIAVSGGDTTARTSQAIDLYRRGWAPTLIFSGAAKDKTGPSNAAAMRELAINAGVPTDDIVIEEYGETTRQNAEETRKILDQYGIRSVILVTSAYHQRRAELEFNKRTEGTVAVRNYPVQTDRQWRAIWWLTPTGWYLAVGELLKIAEFYLGGTR